MQFKGTLWRFMRNSRNPIAFYEGNSFIPTERCFREETQIQTGLNTFCASCRLRIAQFCT